MRGKDLFYAVLIIIIFGALMVSAYLSAGIEHMKKNWTLYRCNPLVMPFAGLFGYDATENMTYCIQNAQTHYMSYILEPVHYAISVTSSIGENLMKDMQSMRTAFSSFRGLAGMNTFNIFSKMINVRIEFQRITYKFKDILSKVIGIQTAFLYILLGGMDTGKSIVNGPIGKTLNAASKL